MAAAAAAATAATDTLRASVQDHPQQINNIYTPITDLTDHLEAECQTTPAIDHRTRRRTSKSRALSPLAKGRTAAGQGLKQGKLKGKALTRCRNSGIFSDDLYYLDKFTLPVMMSDEYHKMSMQAISYYLFHPDRPYSNQSAVGRGGWREQDMNDAGKVLVHWYIALNQLARFRCPLEASPEAWDTRGQRMIPIFEIIEAVSGFNNKTQRDFMAQTYLLMYFRHICGIQGGTDPIKVLKRLGIEFCRRSFSPLLLLCTFCGQYSDVEWVHIDLYDKRALAQEYLDKLRDGDQNGETVRVGVLSVLTCNHPNCANASANGVPKRRNYSGRRDDQDFYCQLSALQLSKGQKVNEMLNIVKNPTVYFPSHLGGNSERERWRKLDLDENTVRYLRMEAYMMKVLNEYSDNCRLCGEYIPDDSTFPRKSRDMQVYKFAQKGNICCTNGTCSWEDAVQKASMLMEQELGVEWSVMVDRCLAMRRGAQEEDSISPTESDESASSLFLVSPPRSDFSEPSDTEALETPQGTNNPGGSRLDEDDDLCTHDGKNHGEVESDAPEEILFAGHASIGAVLQQMDLDEDSWADVEDSGDCSLMDWV